MAEENTKAHVHTMVASVIGWSLKYAALGVFPTTGLFGEELKGWRKQMAGKRIASGWKGTQFVSEPMRKLGRKPTSSTEAINIPWYVCIVWLHVLTRIGCLRCVSKTCTALQPIG